MNNKKEFGKDVLVYGLGNGIKKFIGLFLLPFYTRALTPADYGILDTLSTGIFLITAFLNLGLDSAAGFYFFRTEDEKEKGSILYTKLVINILSFLPILVFVLLSDTISLLLFKSKQYSTIIIITALIIPVNLILSEQSHIFRYYRMPWKYNLITVIKSFTNIGFGISLVVVYSYGVLGAQLASLISSLVVITVSYFFFTQKFYNYKFSINWAKKMLRFGFPLVWAGIIAWVYSSSDRYFILHYKDTTEIGYYSIAATFSQPILLLNMAIQMSFGVLFYSIYNKESNIEKPESKKLVKDTFSIYILTAVFIASFLSIFSYELISVLATKDFLNGIFAIPFLAFSSIFAQAFQITSIGITLKEKTWYYTLIILITAIINVGLNFYMVPNFGFIGAAITTLIAYIFYWAIAYVIAQKYYKLKIRLLRVIVFLTISFSLSCLIPYLELFKKVEIDLSIKLLLFAVVAIMPFIIGIIKFSTIKNIIKTEILGKIF